MIRTLYWFVYFWLYLLFILPPLWRVKNLDRQGKVLERDKIIDRTAKQWAQDLVRATGSKVKVSGVENLPEDLAVVFVSNHQGNFDIPILLGFINKPKAFIAKIELQTFPVISTWMRYMNCIFMNRKDVRQSLRAINQGVEVLKQGYSLVIFPEGTRSKDGSIGEFKPGSFKLATKAKVPIVPVTIKGSNKIMGKKGIIIKPAEVEVIISPPVMVSGVVNNDPNELAIMVKNIILANLEETHGTAS